jgi:hypothetical protein
VLASEQSSGTFVRVAGETDDLRARSRVTVEHIEPLVEALCRAGIDFIKDDEVNADA